MKMKRFLCLLVTVTMLAVLLLPGEVRAAGKVYDLLPSIAMEEDSDELLSAAMGIPYLLSADSGNMVVVITDDDFYCGEEYLYGSLLPNEEVLVLTPYGTYGGLCLLFSDPEPGDFYFPFGGTCTNTTYSAVCYDENGGYTTMKCEFTDINEEPNDIMMFNAVLSLTGEFDDLMLPAPVVNDDGELVGIIAEKGGDYYAYAMTYDMGGGGSDEPEEPEPTQPMQTEPEPSNEPEPSGEPEPSEEPGPGRPGTTEEPEPTPEPGPAFDWKLIALIGGGIVVLGVVAVILGKRKKKSVMPVMTDPQEQFPAPAPIVIDDTVPTAPVEKGATQILNQGWQPIPQEEQAVYAVVTAGPMQNQRFRIPDQGLLVGRDPGAGLVYPPDTAGVSRRHCMIFWQNNELMVKDLGSTSGTYMERRGKLQPNVPVSLDGGDVIYLASTKIALTIRIL